MKPWQCGFDLDYLLSIEAKYGDYNARALGPFAAFKKHLIADRLRRNELHLGKGWAYVLTHAKVASKMTMFQNIAFGQRHAGDRTLSHISVDWADGEWMQEWNRLCSENSPLWIQVYAEDEIAVHEVSKMAARCGTKVTTFGEVFAWFLRTPDDWLGLGRETRRIDCDPAHAYAIGPVQIDASAQAKLFWEQVCAAPPTFQDHYSNYNADHAWGAVSIRGYSPDTSMIAKPSEMNDKWKVAHKDEVFTMQNTVLRGAWPAIESILARFPASCVWHRIRLMRLAPGGGELQRHTDQVDVESGFGLGQLMRIHIPLQTNPDVIFEVWDATGRSRRVHMPAYTTWALDTRWPHRAINGGDTERVHLVMDVETTPELQRLLIG